MPTLTIHAAAGADPVAVHPLGSASALAGLLASVAREAPGAAAMLAGWEDGGVEISADGAGLLAEGLDAAARQMTGHEAGACRLLAGWLREAPEGGCVVVS